jgi:3D (Asp-Asp-Asp) domain-containing protein
MRPMTRRVIDLALIIGLVVVAGAIVWTLFSLGSDPAPTQAAASRGQNASSPQDPGSGGENGIVPVSPGDEDGDGADGDGDGGVVALPPDGGDPNGDDGDAQDGEPQDGADGPRAAAADPDGSGADDDADGPQERTLEDGRPNPDVPAAEAPPVPTSGPVELGRVGFSFVTGGPGACGVELEPWTHVAVSRELLDAYGCGAEVTVTLADETAGRTRFEAVVADTMNEGRSRTVNVYVGEDEPALSYGVTAGTIAPE